MLINVAETVLKWDRAIVIAGLAAVSAIAWVYMLHLASSMTSMEMQSNVGMDINTMEMSRPNMQAWQSGDIVLTFMMLAVMMVAMMTPSATK